jgi:hypothetical protein
MHDLVVTVFRLSFRVAADPQWNNRCRLAARSVATGWCRDRKVGRAG